MKESFTIAAGHVNRFFRSLLDWGVTEEQIFALSHLNKDQLENPDSRIPVETYIKLGRIAPELTHLPEIGLILGQRADFESIGVVFQLASNFGTVRESLLCTVRYSDLANEACKAGFKEGKEFAEWSMQYINSMYTCIPLIEFECCQGLKICKSVLGEEFRPVRIEFQHSPPDHIERYHQVFQVPLLFNQGKCAIVFKKECLDVPNPSPQPYVRGLLARHADTLQREIGKNKLFQDKVRKILLKRLDSGSLNLETIAKELNLSSRSICRNLGKENTSFRTLTGEVRKQLAKDYLKESSFSINDISFKLGFSESSAFHRAFKRWFGMNPGQYRRQAD